MVVLPYKDALVLFSKYLQQLIMESLGKRLDLDGNEVFQGISVYGNKGSTDQHAYVQQLRDGVNNFFATFIEVRECSADAVEVEAGATCGDFLQGFLRGTRQALAESGRSSITISIPEVNAKTLGMLIALFERAVSFYASLVNINAYHQPGVEAGKKPPEPSWPCWGKSGKPSVPLRKRPRRWPPGWMPIRRPCTTAWSTSPPATPPSHGRKRTVRMKTPSARHKNR